MPAAHSPLTTSLLESSIHLLDRLPGVRPERAPHLQLGRDGELAACFYLRRAGYTITARGWTSRRAPGDLDIIAWDGPTLVIIEVKTRTELFFATAESAVDRHKRRTLRRLTRQYLRFLPEGILPRFDILSIYGAELATPAGRRSAQYQLFRNAFDWYED